MCLSCDVFSVASVLTIQVFIFLMALISLINPSSFASLLLYKTSQNDNPIRKLSTRIASTFLIFQTLYGFMALMARKRCPALILIYSFMLLPNWFYSLVMLKINIFYVIDAIFITILLCHCISYCYPVVMHIVHHLRLGGRDLRSVVPHSELVNRQQEQLLLQSANNNNIINQAVATNNNNLELLPSQTPSLLTREGPILTSFYSPAAFLSSAQIESNLVQPHDYPIIILRPAIEKEQMTPNKDIKLCLN